MDDWERRWSKQGIWMKKERSEGCVWPEEQAQ